MTHIKVENVALLSGSEEEMEGSTWTVLEYVINFGRGDQARCSEFCERKLLLFLYDIRNLTCIS